jgi:hypothetical protein
LYLILEYLSDAENALKRVKEVSNLELANQRLKFELAAVANLDASEDQHPS